MPVESWFPTLVFYEDVAVPEGVHAGALEAVTESVDAERLEEVRRYTAAEAPNTLHRDPRIEALLGLLFVPARRFFFEVLRFNAERTRFFVGRCWPVVQAAGGSGGLHTHGGATLSGVFYLETPEGSGALEFRKPTSFSHDHVEKVEMTELTFDTVTYPATRHRLLLFPSNIIHRALANADDIASPRVAIAFDIYSTADIENPVGGFPHAENLLSF